MRCFELGGEGTDVFDGDSFGFVGESEFGEVAEWWQMGLTSTFDNMSIEVGVGLALICCCCKIYNRMVGLVGLNKYLCIAMAAVGAPDGLCEELIATLLTSVVGEGIERIGLGDGEGGEQGEVEAFGNHLRADNNVKITRTDIGVELIGCGVVGGVGVKADDIGSREEFAELSFEEFGADAFVDNRGVLAFWAGGGDFFSKATGVANKVVFVGVED